MEITITDVLPRNGGEDKIAYSTLIGKGIALWAADPPGEGQVYDVEINIDDDLMWGVNIDPSDEEKDYIEYSDEITKISAEIVSNEESSLAIKLLNSIIIIETNTPPKKLPARVKLTVKKVTFYPISF